MRRNLEADLLSLRSAVKDIYKLKKSKICTTENDERFLSHIYFAFFRKLATPENTLEWLERAVNAEKVVQKTLLVLERVKCLNEEEGLINESDSQLVDNTILEIKEVLS